MTAEPDEAVAAPTATLDKATYAPGDTATLTVVRPAGSIAGSVAIPGFAALPFAAAVALPVVVTDSSGHTWALKSDDGTTAKLTTTV